ncbi:hypothetical protein Tco_1215794 [Tanacetum coccineum]
MTILAEHIIVAGAKNRPPMLEKSMYDSWESRIRLFIKGKKHGRMMLDPIDNGPLVYLTIEENWQTRPKKYSELTKAQQLQDDCDVQATNLILHGLPPDVLYNLFDKFAHVQGETLKFVTDQLYAYLSQHERHANEVRISRERYPDPLAFIANSPTLYNLSQPPQYSSSLILAVPMFQQGEDPIECINKAMAYMSAVTSRFPPSNNLSAIASRFPPQTIISNSAFQTEDLDAYDSDCDDLSSAKAVLMANLSSCDPDILSELSGFNQHYDGSVIAKKHAVISVIDDEETLILEEQSRSKMLNDLILVEKKIKISPIDYSKLNKIKEDFGVKPTTNAIRSKPSGNIKNNKITRPPSSNQKNKVEDHSRKVESSLNKMNPVSEPVSNALVLSITNVCLMLIMICVLLIM